MADPQKSIANLLEDLKDRRNADTAQKDLWERHFTHLVVLARKRLEGSPKTVEDEEDVAVSALNSFFGAIQKGRFPDLRDGDELWALLAAITSRKAISRRRRFAAAKRGGGAVRGESALGEANWRGVAGPGGEPDELAVLSEQCARLLGLLPDESARIVAVKKLEGHTNGEIARQLGVSPRTVDRKMSLIRKAWSASLLADA